MATALTHAHKPSSSGLITQRSREGDANAGNGWTGEEKATRHLADPHSPVTSLISASPLARSLARPAPALQHVNTAGSESLFEKT